MRYLVSALILSLLVLGLAGPVAADVITDWSEKVQPIVAAYSLAAPAYRDMPSSAARSSIETSRYV